ncbi:hypothetical protein JCM10212_000279, partial [Sporobolomyces blumeae]
MLAAHRLRSIVHHLRSTTPSIGVPSTRMASSTLPPAASSSSSTSTASSTRDDPPKFPLSPVPQMDKVVRTAGMLVIGDEILNGKTRDTNSNFLAKLTFDLGIELKRIEVIADDEAEIGEAVTRMHKNYDWVVTCGGIGPTHDDITYESIAKAFKVGVEHDDETVKRMEAMSKGKYDWAKQTDEQRTARMRMALFPKGAERLFVQQD